MVTVVHIYNRWSKSELNCYVDGNLVSHTEMSWLVNTSDVSWITRDLSFIYQPTIFSILTLFVGLCSPLS